jgi:hypothetical protein
MKKCKLQVIRLQKSIYKILCNCGEIKGEEG